jgi:hypothetical protein
MRVIWGREDGRYDDGLVGLPRAGGAVAQTEEGDVTRGRRRGSEGAGRRHVDAVASQPEDLVDQPPLGQKHGQVQEEQVACARWDVLIAVAHGDGGEAAVREAEGEGAAVAELGGELAEVRAVGSQRDAELAAADKEAHAACTAGLGLEVGPQMLPDGAQGQGRRDRGLHVQNEREMLMLEEEDARRRKAGAGRQ